MRTSDVYIVYNDYSEVVLLDPPEGDLVFTKKEDAYDYIERRNKDDSSLNLHVATLKEYIETFEKRLDNLTQDG